VRGASCKRDRIFADEAEQRNGLFEGGFSAPAQAFKLRRGRAGNWGEGICLIGYLPPYDFQQFGEFRAQVAHLHGGTLVVQPPQEFLQDPSASGIESLDARTVDDHL
jgi:hypothetical protein